MNFGNALRNLEILTSILQHKRCEKGNYIIALYTNDSKFNFIKNETLLEKEIFTKFNHLETQMYTNKHRRYNYNGEETTNNFYLKRREIVCWDFQKFEEREFFNGEEYTVFKKN
jgi:hypothetical protein